MATHATIAAVAPGPLTLAFETRRPQRRRQLRFDVMAGDALIAHVRAMVMPGPEPERFSAVVTVPPGAVGQLSIAAWPLRRGEDDDTPDEAALPFRVARVPATGMRAVLWRTLHRAGGVAG
jgi:hypothetical protein